MRVCAQRMAGLTLRVTTWKRPAKGTYFSFFDLCGRSLRLWQWALRVGHKDKKKENKNCGTAWAVELFSFFFISFWQGQPWPHNVCREAVSVAQSWPAKRKDKKNACAFTDSPITARRRRKVLTQVMRHSQHNAIVSASRPGWAWPDKEKGINKLYAPVPCTLTGALLQFLYFLFLWVHTILCLRSVSDSSGP